MVRMMVRLALAPAMPRAALADGRNSLFGGWLVERITSIALDWPAVGFCRIDVQPDSVALILTARAGAPPVAVGAAVARAIRTEVQTAALACCGLADGAALWRAETVIVVEHEPGRHADAA